VPLFASGPVDAYTVLYVLPVALLSTAFGLRGGVVGGAVALLLTVIWAVARDVSLGSAAWASRLLPLLLLGVLLGEASDRLRRAEAARREAEGAALLHGEAVEINDQLVQGMVAARWAFESGRTEDGMELLEHAIEEGHLLVSGLIRRAGLGSRSERLGSALDET